MPAISLLPASSSLSYVWSDTHYGAFTLLPGTASGSQSVEAMHAQWKRLLPKHGAPRTSAQNRQGRVFRFRQGDFEVSDAGANSGKDSTL